MDLLIHPCKSATSPVLQYPECQAVLVLHQYELVFDKHPLQKQARKKQGLF